MKWLCFVFRHWSLSSIWLQTFSILSHYLIFPMQGTKKDFNNYLFSQWTSVLSSRRNQDEEGLVNLSRDTQMMKWWERLLVTTHLNTLNEADTPLSYCMCVLFSTLRQPHTDIGRSLEKFAQSFSEEQFLSWVGNLKVLFRNLWSFLGSVKILDTSKGNEFWLERKRCLERLKPQILIWK